MDDLYQYFPPENGEVPILVSVPHSGTAFPGSLAQAYTRNALSSLEDTDWYVDRLYSFAPSMGIGLIKANYSRWLIDLNRNPENKPLYDDGRLLTSLCPSTSFAGSPLYVNTPPSPRDVERRREAYYWPYYHEVQRLLDGIRQRHGVALLWDAHSIKSEVDTIHKDPFPAMILGSDDGRSASQALQTIAFEVLGNSVYQAKHNYLFKGGHITRYFGKPASNQHALQLEMVKANYMDEQSDDYLPKKAEEVQNVLKATFAALGKHLVSKQ